MWAIQKSCNCEYIQGTKGISWIFLRAILTQETQGNLLKFRSPNDMLSPRPGLLICSQKLKGTNSRDLSYEYDFQIKSMNIT